jgi:hypothetical protein
MLFYYYISIYLYLSFNDPEEMARIISWGGFVCPPAEEGLSAR